MTIMYEWDTNATSFMINPYKWLTIVRYRNIISIVSLNQYKIMKVNLICLWFFLYFRQRSSWSYSCLSCTIMKQRLTSWLTNCRRRPICWRRRTEGERESRRKSKRRRRNKGKWPGNWPKWSSPSKSRLV